MRIEWKNSSKQKLPINFGIFHDYTIITKNPDGGPPRRWIVSVRGASLTPYPVVPDKIRCNRKNPLTVDRFRYHGGLKLVRKY